MFTAHPKLRDFALACLVGLQPIASWPATTPGIPEALPGGFSGLRMTATTFVYAVDPTFQHPGSSQYDTTAPEERALITSDYTARFELTGGGFSVTSGTSMATAGVFGTAAFGELRAAATVHLVGGRTEGSSRVVSEFYDFIQVRSTDPEVSNLNYDVSWKTDGVVSRGAFAIAQVWIIDADVLPPSTYVNTGMFLQSTWSPEGVADFRLGDAGVLQLGQRYWVYGRLRVEAARAHNFYADGTVSSETYANFDHTARLFIDPHPDTPGAFITSASGFDYRTPAIPEPGNMALICAGLIALAARRNRQLASAGPDARSS